MSMGVSTYAKKTPPQVEAPKAADIPPQKPE
jgi:hypothetical protein